MCPIFVDHETEGREEHVLIPQKNEIFPNNPAAYPLAGWFVCPLKKGKGKRCPDFKRLEVF